MRRGLCRLGFTLALLVSTSATAAVTEEWSRLYNDPSAYVSSLDILREADDGGYFAAGDTGRVIARTDADGNLLWTYTPAPQVFVFFGNYQPPPYYVYGTFDLRVLPGGGAQIISFYADSYIAENPTQGFLITSVDAAGNLTGEKFVAAQGNGYAVQPRNAYFTDDGGFVGCGITISADAYSNDSVVTRFDGSGNAVWSTLITESTSTTPGALAPAPDGGVFVQLNSLNTAVQEHEIHEVRLSASGEVIYDFMELYYDKGYLNSRLLPLPDGSLLEVGNKGPWEQTPDIAVRRISPTGAPGGWTILASFSPEAGVQFSDVRLAPDGDILIAGDIYLGYDPYNSWDYYVLKVSPEGLKEFEGSFGSEFGDAAGQAVLRDDGKLVICGERGGVDTYNGILYPYSAAALTLITPDMPPEPDPVIEVSIDILPNDGANVIRNANRGIIPVAIFSGAGFDAASLDVATLRLGEASVAARGNSRLHAWLRDMNRDGLLDLVAKFDFKGKELEPGQHTLSLTGVTTGGQQVSGADTVTVEAPKKNGKGGKAPKWK